MAGFAARSDGLVAEELDGGLVVYDVRSDRAHWLDREATAVWRACESGRTLHDIAGSAGIEPAMAEATLARLESIGLVEQSGAVSRRTMLRYAAKVGAAGAVGAPIISALIPVAAAHASTPGNPGGNPGGPPDGPGPLGVPTEIGGVFLIPAGYKVSFSSTAVNGCNWNTIGYQLIGASLQSLLSNNHISGVCDSSPTTATGGGQTIGPFGVDRQMVINLHSYNGGSPGGTFDFPSSNPLHAAVASAGQYAWTVYLSDDYASGCGPGCPNVPGRHRYNAKVTVTVSV
jgi:hypothetical protein